MILDALIGGAIALLTGVLALVPTFSMPEGIVTGATKLGEALGGLNSIFPVSMIGICLAAIIAVQLFIWIFDLCVFIYQLFPFKAT